MRSAEIKYIEIQNSRFFSFIMVLTRVFGSNTFVMQKPAWNNLFYDSVSYQSLECLIFSIHRWMQENRWTSSVGTVIKYSSDSNKYSSTWKIMIFNRYEVGISESSWEKPDVNGINSSLLLYYEITFVVDFEQYVFFIDSQTFSAPMIIVATIWRWLWKLCPTSV